MGGECFLCACWSRSGRAAALRELERWYRAWKQRWKLGHAAYPHLKAVGLLKHLDPDAWHVTVVAPDNYFLFHPLLPSATVGTVEVRSLVEPLRKIIAKVSGHFLQAKCVFPLISMAGADEEDRAIDVDFSERLLEVESPGTENFYLPVRPLGASPLLQLICLRSTTDWSSLADPSTRLTASQDSRTASSASSRTLLSSPAAHPIS